MNENTIGGGFKVGTGTVEGKMGEALDRPDLQARGSTRQVEGKVQETIGSVQDAVSQAADKVSTTASKLGDQARDAYGQASEKVQAVAKQVDPIVQEQPYLAIGVAAVAGLLLGLLIAGRGPKIIYVKPPA